MSKPAMFCDFTGKTVLVTGGTKGIGLACGLTFARVGARCILTYRWGSADEDELRKQFLDLGAPEPLFVRADVSRSEDTDALIDEIAARHDRVDVFVSNATGAIAVRSIEDLTERALLSTIRYGVWPTVEYLKKLRSKFNRDPRYVIAISTTGIDAYTRNYDLVAASKASLEALCRYLAYRFRDQDCRINVIRTRGILTESMKEVVGDDLQTLVDRFGTPRHLVSAEEIAQVALGLCSGFLDDMSGQVLTVDRGGLFCDNLARLYTERKKLGLEI